MKPAKQAPAGLRPRAKSPDGVSDPYFQDNPLPMWVYDSQSLRFLDVNRAAVKLYGYSKAEFLAKSLADITADGTGPHGQTPAQIAKRQAGWPPDRCKHYRKDGTLVPVDVTSAPLEYDGHAAILATMRGVKESAETEQYLAALLDATPDSMVVIDERGKIVLINRQMEARFGYPREELVGKNVEVLLPRRLRTRHRGHRLGYFADPRARLMGPGLDLHAVARDGSEIPVEIRVSPLDLEQGRWVVATIRDVTERKAVEAALRQSQKRLSEAQHLAHLGSHEYDVLHHSLYWSDEVFEIFGIAPENFRGLEEDFLGRVHPEDRERVIETIDRAIRQRVGTEFEHRLIRPNGEVRVVRENFVPYFDAKGNHIRNVGTIQDVTEQHAVQEVLSYAGTVINASPVGILTCKATGQIVSANEAVARMIGGSTDELQHQNFRELKSWQQSGLLKAAEIALASQTQQNLEAHGVSTFGQEFWFDARLIPFDYAGEMHLLVLLSDILAQKNVQHDLQRREADYRDLVENTQVLMCTHDLDGNLLSVNSWAEQVLGYTRDELLGRNIGSLLEPEQRPLFRRYLRTVRASGEVRGEMRVRTASGQQRIWEYHNTLRTEGMPQPIVHGTAYDITERREAEDALRASEAAYKMLFEAAPIGIGLTDMHGHLLAFNDAILQPGGYSREDILATPDLASFYADPAQRAEVLARLEQQGYVSKHEVKFKRKDGSAYHALLTLTKLVIEGKPRLQALMEDISQQRAAEAAQRQSEAMYRELFNNALEGIFRTTPDGRFLSANPALVRMLGYESEADLLSLHVQDVYFEARAREQNLDKINENGEIRDLEVELKRRDGTALIALENARTVQDENGQVVLYEGALTDITRRKKAEEALRASEAELRAIFEASPDLILVIDKGGRYLKVGPGRNDMLYAPGEELVGRTFHEVFSRQKAEEFVGYIRKALRTGKPVHFEYALLIGSRIMWFSGATAPLTDDTVVWVARDITPQKEAEDQLQRRLADLETLYQSGLVLSQMLEPAQIGQKIIDVLSERLHWHHAVVRVRRGDTDEVELLAFSQIPGEESFAVDGRALARAAITKIGQGMSGWVIKHGRMINCPDLSTDPRYHETFPNMLSGLYVPIWASGRVLGCISVEAHQREAFTEADELLLTTLASQAAAALENARLFSETQKRASESLDLYEATRGLAAQSDLATLLSTLVERVTALMKVRGAAVFLVDAETNELEAVATDQNVLPVGIRLNFGEGLAGRVAQTRQPLTVDDYRTWEGRVAKMADRPLGALIGVPMLYRGELIGVLLASEPPSDRPAGQNGARHFTQEDVRLLELFATGAAGALFSARLFEVERSRRQEAEMLRAAAVRSAERLSTLHTATWEIAHLAQDPEQLYVSIHEATRRLMPVEAFTITLASEDGKQIEGVYLFDRTGRAPSMVIPFGEGFSSQVIQSGETILIRDLPAAPVKAVHFGSPESVRSVLAVPLRVGGRVIGAISAQSYTPNVYQPEDQVLFEMLAAQAAIAIQNARLFEETRRRLHEFESLAKVGNALTGTMEFESLLDDILRAACQAIPAAEKGTILLRELNGQGTLHVRAQVGYHEPHLAEAPFDGSKGYAGRALKDKLPLLVRDAPAEYEIPFDGQFEEVNAVQSAIVAPLIVKDQAIGAISLDNASRTAAFGEEDLRLLMLFASSAAVVIENARLFNETLRRADEFEILYETTRDISSQSPDLSRLLPTLVDKASRLLSANGSGLYLYDALHEDLELVAVSTGGDGIGAHVKLGEGAAGLVAQTQRPLRIDDYQTWAGRRSLLEGTPFRAVLQVPLIYAGELIGVLDAYEYGESERRFSESDEKLLSLFAAQAAGAVHSARLFEETRKKAAQFANLYETARDLADERNLDQLLQMLVDRAAILLNAPISGIYLYDKARNDLYVAVDRGLPSSLGNRLALGEGVAGRVAQSRRPMIIEDYRLWEARSPLYEGSDLRSVLEVPMLYGGELIGVLTVDENGDSERKFTHEDADLLTLFASYAASAVHTARLFEQVSMRAAEFEALYETAADLASQTDVQTLLDTVIERSRALMSVAGAAVYLFHPQAGDLELAAVNDPDFEIGSHMALGDGLAGRVALAKEPLMLNDYRAWEGRSAQYEGLPITATMGVPMLYNGQLIGVLNVFNRADREPGDGQRIFTAEDAHLLDLFASAVAGAVYVARLLEQTRRRVEQLSALHAVDTAIGSTTDLRVSLQAVLENLMRQLHVDATDVLLLSPSTLLLKFAAGTGFFTSTINRSSASIGRGQAGKVALERHMIYIPDLAAETADFVRSDLIAAERFKAYVGVPLIAKGEVKGVLEIFQRGPLQLDEERKSLLEMLAGQAALAVDNAALFEGLEKANMELTMAYDATIEGWSQALEMRDQETQGHSDRVLQLTMRLTAAMGLSNAEMREIRRGVLLHDIGKMGIPDSILHKPGPLTAEEWQIMRQHPQYAFDMLSPIAYLRNSLDIPYAHHEKWDGTGYPRGLKGETIPLAARIFSVVDVYDALTSNRPYRGAWSKEKAVRYIEEESGRHFDPGVVEAFLKLLMGGRGVSQEPMDAS